MKIEQIRYYDGGKTWVAYGSLIANTMKRHELMRGTGECPASVGDEVENGAVKSEPELTVSCAIDTKDRSIARAVALKAAVEICASIDKEGLTKQHVDDIMDIAARFEAWLVRK